MRITTEHIVLIGWLSKSLALVALIVVSSVIHKGFKAASPGSDYIENIKEVAYSINHIKVGIVGAMSEDLTTSDLIFVYPLMREGRK